MKLTQTGAYKFVPNSVHRVFMACVVVIFANALKNIHTNELSNMLFIFLRKLRLENEKVTSFSYFMVQHFCM